MKDHLLDIVRNTFDLGCITAVKVTGTDRETMMDAMADDLTVLISARFHKPVPEFIGLFGMPNLDKLRILLNIPEYQEGAMIMVNRQDRGGQGVMEPVGLHFVNAAGDFHNDYRFMTANIVAEKLRTAKPKKQPTWVMEFEPSVANVQRLKMQAQANSEEKNLQARTENQCLRFSFGDHSSHAGDFVFQAGVSGTLSRAWSWPARQLIAILDLAGDRVIRISDEGVMQIQVDSGLALYQYSLIAQTK